MKKFFLVVVGAFICIQLAGCSGWAIHATSSLEPRVDQEISGNRGVILGEATSEPKEPSFTERKVYKIDIELPHWPEDLSQDWQRVKKGLGPRPPKQREKKDTGLWGNKGYIFRASEKGAVEEMSISEFFGETQLQGTPAVEAETVKAVPEKITKEITSKRTYKVRKGDTLQKISYRLYGTTKKWLAIYKANKDELKSPDKLYPGQVLVIPEAGAIK